MFSMAAHNFPSGPWVGFYTYAGSKRKYMMNLMLEFKKEKMTGEGADGVGMFIISGSYSSASGECSWVKQYIGRHAVDYKGYREGKGIWGNWTLTQARGGFHIWPLSEGGPANATKEKEKRAKPQLATT